jgi:hypothetical protein
LSILVKQNLFICLLKTIIYLLCRLVAKKFNFKVNKYDIQIQTPTSEYIMQCPGWREKRRRERKTRISINEFKLKIRPNTSIGIRIFLSSQFLSLKPSKG